MSVSKKPASKSTSTKSPASHVNVVAEAAETATVAPVAAAPAAAHLAPPSTATAPTASLVSFPAPPPIALIPTVPAGYLAPESAQFRGILPQQAEQTALEAAITDLGRIPDYALFVGAPPLALFIQMLTLAGQWTTVRNASFKWDAYAASQEGSVWSKARPLMDEFNDAFAQAQKVDSTLAAQLPGLTTFLGVRSAVAQKGVTTKRANKKAEAAGERPAHGKVGKQRKRAAEKAALVAADASAESAPTGTEPTTTTGAGATAGAQANGATHS